MTQDKFIALTRRGEGAQIEYKTCTEEISESLYESVCSFLNHTGGQILVGVQDDGTIVGVNPDRVEALKTNIINCINNPELFLPCPYCVHTDFSSGFACFFHVFKDRVVTKNPTRLLPEIPEGELTIQQLSNYTKNPLLVRVFHELHWAEDLGSGTRNILRYAPLYYPGYKIEINSGQQFVFSITYQDENVTVDEKMSPSSDDNVPELTDEELALPLEPYERLSVKEKKNRRRQAIVGLMKKDSHISIESISEKLDVHKRTIFRDIEDLKKNHVIERIGGNYGEWKVVIKKNGM